MTMCEMIKSLQSPQLNEQGNSSRASDESSITNCKEIDQTGKDNKKQNLRQRLRSMREDWSDGPLLASFEDINDIEDNNTFVVANKSRKGKKVKSPKLTNKLHDENDTTAPSISSCEPSNEITEAVQHNIKLDSTEESESSSRLNDNDERIDGTHEEILQRINVASESKTVKEDASSCRKIAWSNSDSKNGKRVHDSEECAICFQPWQGDKVILEECGHCFHALCIHTWKKQKNTCPFCKTYFILLDDYPKLS